MPLVSKSPLPPFSKGGNIKAPFIKGVNIKSHFIKGGFRGIFLTGFNLTLTFPCLPDHESL